MKALLSAHCFPIHTIDFHRHCYEDKCHLHRSNFWFGTKSFTVFFVVLYARVWVCDDDRNVHDHKLPKVELNSLRFRNEVTISYVIGKMYTFRSLHNSCCCCCCIPTSFLQWKLMLKQMLKLRVVITGSSYDRFSSQFWII